MSAAAPTTPTAWILTKAGSVLTNLKKESIEQPQPKGNQVLVTVRAAALNPVDWKFASLPGFAQTLPRILGGDVAGTVHSYGPNVSKEDKARLPVGSRVFGLINTTENAKDCGTLSTHALVNATRLAPIPDEVDDQHAAGLALVGMTAATMITKSGFQKGDKVLVLGGSTSVGLLLLQMLKNDGAGQIVTTASGKKVEAVKEMGADIVFDYRQVNVNEELKKQFGAKGTQFDVILDAVGDQAVHRACPAFLKPDGHYYNVGAGIQPGQSLTATLGFVWRTTRLFAPRILGGVPRKSTSGFLDPQILPAFYERYIKTGAVKGRVDSTFGFDEVIQAFEHLQKGRSLGKVIINVTAA